MVSERDTTRIRRFVCGQLRGEPDLSSLTIGILKKRYLAHVGCDSLSPDARNYMKQVVQQELMKMQDSDKSGSDQETKKPQNKRKREKEDVITSESEDESEAKKARCQSSSSSESEDKNDCKSESEESEGEAHIQLGSKDTKKEVKKSQPKTNGNDEQQVTSKDSNDEESNESEKEGNQTDFEDKLKRKVKKKANTTNNGETKSSKTNKEKKTSESDDENQTDTDKSELSSKIKNNDSSDEDKKESAEKKNNESDSDSSSLPSLEDEQSGGMETKQDNKKRKIAKKDESTRDQKDENKAIVRLKRYIALCGVRRNYKKLLDGCRSVRSKVAVLKKELEDLGVHGNPSIDKCKKVRMKREEAQELADLDVSNIIATQGRPKRRGASVWQEPKEPPSSAYKRTLNSDSDSNEENNGHRGHRRATDWANLQGIISDDGESD
ncbi:HIRA-interacting protein 3 [Betta splendens]|uniref:HIRA-interacting protein 3 n=1 Tax=Betta splendens TaxID=158456 RepID=A0A6P7N7S7_BETSP|nr:HIRA-interacting protein 3 [Betta splendens]